ncbi:methylmalonyl Co-A mutase-associated GTPase MeaB [Robertmurraya korlensis]|uniref:methylmalonyl Co-A mutase-associated GTPase MeaB n=1 Tax=Robertmurraya korlensis TaxID=519977 RepID=UPI000824A7CD|nr:methylmalonyl Co-A mutase-associated GTPase MeaB [Robertmurraya korlensis]
MKDNQKDNPISSAKRFRKKVNNEPTVEELCSGVRSGRRSMLAKAITLIESNADHHYKKAQELLQQILPFSGNSVRIGITGVPGAGKSTFIDSFGMYLCKKGIKVAVLAVDPSSSLSGGSILGDKTRMEQLARTELAFIRPSPTGGKLGGVHRKTKESIALCEAAGYEVIIVETVGVGQSEVMVRDMVDFFILLVLTGAGDELQGMKKGIMELADAIVVNKADGINEASARKTRDEYNQILHFLQPSTPGWETRAHLCSSLYHKGVEEIWRMIDQFTHQTRQSGVFADRRSQQTKDWLHALITDQLLIQFYGHEKIKEYLPQLERAVVAGDQTVPSAVEDLFSYFYDRK